MDVLNKLQKQFEDQMAVKAEIERFFGAFLKKTRDKMQQATDLIGGLAGERKRWTEDSAKFDATKTALVGDVAVGCAFVLLWPLQPGVPRLYCGEEINSGPQEEGRALLAVVGCHFVVS